MVFGGKDKKYKNTCTVLDLFCVSASLFLSVPPTHFCVCDSPVEIHFLPRHCSLLSLRARGSLSYTSFHQMAFYKAHVLGTVQQAE